MAEATPDLAAGTELTAVRYGHRLLLLQAGHPVHALTLIPGQRYYRQPSQPLLEPTPPTEQDAPRRHRAGPPGPAPACHPGAAEAHSSRVAHSAIAPGDARQGALEL